METGPGGKVRCFGNKPGHAIYAKYHDEQWGIPEHDDRMLFEMLILEGAQAGLSWETILNKRDGYRAAFKDFDVQKVARMNDAELEKLRRNTAIVRNRLKIYAARRNARVFIEIQKEFGSFATYLWSFVGGIQKVNTWKRHEDVPTETEESRVLSKDLQKRGMTFVGPTIIYAYMQAVGLVNDHVKGCWKFEG